MSVNVFLTPSIPADEHLLHTLTITRSLSSGNDNGIEHSKKTTTQTTLYFRNVCQVLPHILPQLTLKTMLWGIIIMSSLETW